MSVVTPDDIAPLSVATPEYDTHFFHPWAELDVPANELYIYKGANYEGDQWNLQFDVSDKERAYYFQLKGTGFDNEVTSWKLGRNLYADFCTGDLVWDESATEADPVFNCVNQVDSTTPGGSAAGEAAVTQWRPDDELSGVILYWYDPATNPAATLYTGVDCTGRSAALFTNDLQPQSYNQGQMYENGLIDDSVKSFMAPVGVWVHAFDDGNLTGGDFKNQKFPGQEDQNGWMVCQNFDASWSATISSVQISWEAPAPVRGKWIMIGEGEHTHRYYSGFFTAETDKPATVSQGDLLASFEVGLEFINRHCSVHQLVSEEIRLETYREMSVAFERTELQTGLCPPRLPLDGKIGYFVYVVETQDGDASIINAQGVCRYGDDWDVAPLCPPAACLDAECNECRDWYTVDVAPPM